MYLSLASPGRLSLADSGIREFRNSLIPQLLSIYNFHPSPGATLLTCYRSDSGREADLELLTGATLAADLFGLSIPAN